MVSTLDFESSDPSSNLGRTWLKLFFVHFIRVLWRPGFISRSMQDCFSCFLTFQAQFFFLLCTVPLSLISKLNPLQNCSCPDKLLNFFMHKAKWTPRQISLLPLVSRPRSIIRQLRKSLGVHFSLCIIKSSTTRSYWALFLVRWSPFFILCKFFYAFWQPIYCKLRQLEKEGLRIKKICLFLAFIHSFIHSYIYFGRIAEKQGWMLMKATLLTEFTWEKKKEKREKRRDEREKIKKILNVHVEF